MQTAVTGQAPTIFSGVEDCFSQDENTWKHKIILPSILYQVYTKSQANLIPQYYCCVSHSPCQVLDTRFRPTVYDEVLYITSPWRGFPSLIAPHTTKRVTNRTIRRRKANAHRFGTSAISSAVLRTCGCIEHGKSAQRGVIYPAVV